MYAANGRSEYLKILLAHKDITVIIQEKEGKTALQLTSNEEIKELLKQHGATE